MLADLGGMHLSHDIVAVEFDPEPPIGCQFYCDAGCARRKPIPSSAARADPRGPAAEVADTAVGKAVDGVE
jgi:hypothetical protein